MKRILWPAQTALFYLLTLAGAILPASFIQPAGKAVGGLMALLLFKRRRIAIDNIRRALPFMKQHPAWTCPLETPEEIARELFRHLGISLLETCRLYHGRGDAIISSVEIRGSENFERARAHHKGIIFVTGHCGNWELLALAFSRTFDAPMSVVARRQNNPYLNTMVETMRLHYNNKVIYKDGGLRQMLGVLKKDGIIGILGDQAVFPEDGTLIDVLGRKAWATKAQVIIGRKTGAPLVPAFIHREGAKSVITLYPEYELGSDTSDEGIQRDVQALSRYVENFAVAHPADWYWVHRRWKRAGEPSC
ncbi:lysophospholipid acyltransferase family protein [Oryzomonas japonica]|uniref:Lysophospholipid acyltransferase family protein n=1 Tax=Oryzomonas japonica TaxID=2603858 RepID=A0A7J4ZQ58_9BACT|nr:lysophospholipid acyltransferase family protein [Oryzomonas japonica]KAB0665135.1 lysophospholipid acyltransferase family protein [Oryzomonas japonica]